MKAKTGKGVEGKVCVVTGAAGVLCASLTEDLLRHGAKVAVLDLRGDVARKLCATLAKKGLKETLAIEANVLDKASLVAARTAVLKKYINFWFTLLFTVIGGILYYMVVVVVLWLRLNSNDLKLFTAILVAAALALPLLQRKFKERRRRAVD